MGNPMYGYKRTLIKFIEYGKRETDSGFVFSNDEFSEMMNKDSCELEEMALSYYKNNYPMACMILGCCISDHINAFHEYCDMMNAYGSAMSMLYELFGINDENPNYPWPNTN